jgi:hypothetical protein
MAFDTQQIRSFVKQVKAQAGNGWTMLGPRLQRALITERALYIMGSQVETMELTSRQIHDLNNAMLAEAGLVEEP